MSTKTEITPLKRAGVAGRVVPTAVAGPAGYRHTAGLRPRSWFLGSSAPVGGAAFVGDSGLRGPAAGAIG
ncbi:hypothetical protein HII28_07715 [Planctomonas sp. JC2975]|uniref:hypothetical protein n=1 Tax=Planctomonas sp. JC2975 TaxID=2729626 RepID=UPI001472FA03|nr:hypothetical protein [Planctomonas sp. JC2975]NNC11761.1 hypothetical protein [Planctomonas sp. JC2975]